MKITVIPDSVRLDPVNMRLFEYQPDLYKKTIPKDYLYNNHIWKETDKTVRIKSAGNETISFQVIMEVEKEAKEVSVSMDSLVGSKTIDKKNIHLFKEWFGDVQVPSSGYEKTSMGKGWYPDALVPIEAERPEFGNPFYIPDFRNRIPNQKAAAIWVDVYVPDNQEKGIYKSTFKITSKNLETIEVPIELEVWPFSLPMEDTLKGNFWTSYFQKFSIEKELRYQHALKQNRLSHHVAYYRPDCEVVDGVVKFDWTSWDERVIKYLDGSAFTDKYGYSGTGYGEPIEYLLLPFNISGGKFNKKGWPVDTAVEQDDAFWKTWTDAALEIKKHIVDSGIITPKTQIQVFLNALDESYDDESLKLLKLWSKKIKEVFPDIKYRIDGGYPEEAMEFLKPDVDLCIFHTINYDVEKVEHTRSTGVTDWIYGPIIYESKANALTGASSFIDISLNTMRSLGWLVHKNKAETWCQWEICSNMDSIWYNPESYKNNDLKEFRLYNGSGTMVYDGETLGLPDPCVSIRIKAGRSSSQEWEYIKIYEKLVGSADAIVDSLVYDECLGRKCIGNIEPWNTNIADWDKARLEMGEAIASKC